jgi:hypothetical protein
VEIITKAHWRGWNSDDEEVAKWARESTDENFRVYGEQLEALRKRLNERNFHFFKSSLHDGRLISFSVGDGLHLELENGKPVTIRDFYRTSVQIRMLNAEFNAVYDLKYQGVSKAVFDFPSDDPLWGKNIDDWGYDELSEVNEKILRHEILFSSGSTVLIEFEKFSFKKKLLKGSRY